MSRPTDAARYEQANRWMMATFGETMPAYLTQQVQTPITAAVRDITTILKNSGARQLLSDWKEEDRRTSAGVNPIITVDGALALLLVHMRLGRIPHIVAMTNTLHALNQSNRQALGLDHVVDQLKSYDRIWSALQRLIVLVDEFYTPDEAPSTRKALLSAEEYATVLRLRDPERCRRNRARMHELANMLIEGSLRMTPAEVLARWEGNFAGDATVVAMLGKAGNSSDKSKKRRSVNHDGGYYGRGGDHAGYTMEDAKIAKANGKNVTGTPVSKLLWGIEAEIARMTPNVDAKDSDFPLYTTTIGFHIPGETTGEGAALARSMCDRGHKINYAMFDRLYPHGLVQDFHLPIRLLGGKLVFDYASNEFGVRAMDEERGFVQVVGSWYLDTLPARLREIDKPIVDLRDKAKKPLAELAGAEKRFVDRVAKLKHLKGRHGPVDKSNRPKAIQTAIDRLKEAKRELDTAREAHKDQIKQLHRAEKTYANQLDQRNKYRLTPKGRVNPDGSRRYTVPDTSQVVGARPQRYTKKTVIITADITAAGNPGGLKHEQSLIYGTPTWRKVYGLRNGVESVNRNLKRVQNEDLQNANRRHVRGNTFTYIVAGIAAVCENIRKLLKYLKDKLAMRPVTAKNSDVPTIFWEPDTATPAVEPTLRT
jgi:hypothetical protein